MGTTKGATDVQVRVLGQIEAAEGKSHLLGGPTQRRVFGALVARRNQTVSIGELVEICWPDGDAPGRAEHNVRTYVHRLRTALGDDGDRIETVSAGYRLRLAHDELDVDRFEELATAASRLIATGDVVDALDRMDEAHSLWRGSPYAELADEPWALAEVAHLTELRWSMNEQRAEALLSAGRAADAAASLESMIREEPLRERPRALLMRALYETGRQAEALRAFQDFRCFLIDEAGVEPSPDLVTLDRAIAAGELSSSSGRSRTVGNYQLHERLGEGAFAVVHRATQASLGREVAVKIVRAELADRPEFVRRFEAEAQMVAAIEHPNVVPLYDYWREPGQAFLVMRWMTGGSLETRLDDGPWSLDTTVDLVDQIAAALDAAHAHGVVHRDVKPGNILFDDAGRAYLGDFGIALAADERSTPQAALSEGSPIFAAPEQLRREPAGPEADVHALAIVAFTMLTGRTPFADSADEATLLRRQLDEAIPPMSAGRPELPASLDEVVAIATAKHPVDRYPTASDFAAAFRSAATGATTAHTLTGRERRNPYKGLRAFDETDAADFHGRRRLVDELVTHLRRPDARLLALVGPSGSGKSSVVRAGLVPALRDGRVPGSSTWFTTTLIPGTHPFESLETALLRVAVNPPSALLDQLRDGDRGILRGVKRILPDDDAVIAIVIDQFEELFNGGVTADERDRFLGGLATAVDTVDSPVRLLLTLRADFYDGPLRDPRFAPLLRRNTIAVGPLAPDELEEAVANPVAAVGVSIEAGLLAEIVADVNSQPGALPLLQYALTQAFEHDDGDTLTIDAYHSIGGLAGALGRRADELWRTADSEEQHAARRLLGRLVTLGEGSEDTRRRVRVSELGDDPSTVAAIQRFAGARLLTFDRDPATREPTVEVAHEALIREWQRLRRWLDDDRDALRTHRHLTIAADGWLARDRDPGELYRGGRLETANTWAADHRPDLNAIETEFLDASIAAHDAEEAAERAHLEQQARSNRRLRVLAAIAAVVALIAASAGVFALQQRSRADDEAAEARAQAAAAEDARDDAETARAAEELARQEADASASDASARAIEADTARLAEVAARQQADFDRLVALARTTEIADPTVGLLLAVEANRFWNDVGSPIEWDASEVDRLGGLHRALTARSGFLGWLGSEQVRDITVLDDGERLVTHTADTIDVWNVATRTKDASWPYPRDFDLPTDIVFLSSVASSDGGLVAASEPGGITVLDLRTGAQLARIERTSGYAALAISPDLRQLATGFDDGVVDVWEIADPPRLVATVARPAQVGDVQWSPDGRTLAIGTFDGGTTLWDPTSQIIVWEDDGVAEDAVDNAAVGFLFSSDGDRLVLSTQTSEQANASGRASGVRAIRVLDTSTGDDLIEPIVDEYTRTGIAWLDSTERSVVATSSSTGPISVFDVAVGDEVVRQAVRAVGETKTGVASGLGVFPELGIVATGGSSGIELRSIDGSGPLTTLAALAPAQQAVRTDRTLFIGAFADDNQRLVTSMLSTPLVLPHVVDLDRPLETPVEYLPTDGGEPSFIVDQYEDFTLHLMPAGFVVRLGVGGEVQGPPIPFDPQTLGAVSLSRRGDRLMLDEADEVVLYDVASGERVAALDPDMPFTEFLFTNGMFSHDGSTLNITTYFESASFDAATGELRWATDRFGFAFPLADDTTIVTAAGLADPTIRIRDAETFEEVGDPLVGHQSGISWINLHPGEPWLATTGRDGTIRVWDLDTSRQLGRELPSDQAGVGIWSPDGQMLAVPSSDGYLVWNYDTDTWADIACEVAGRNLTPEEWEEFGPRTIEYRATCPAFPLDR